MAAYLGLFGQLASGAEVKDLGVVDVNITGSGYYVGGLVGYNDGTVTQCYSTGAVSRAVRHVGGLVGYNRWHCDPVLQHRCGQRQLGRVGGLVGCNGGTVTQCYSTGAVSGSSSVGGLVDSDGDQLGRTAVL